MVPVATPRRLFLLGGVAILFGILAAAWPISTVLTLVVVWGIYALVDGVALIIDGIRGRRESRGWSIAMGVLGVLAGLVAIIHPVSSAATFAWIIGLWLVVRGVAQAVEGFRHTHNGAKWLTVLAGVAYAIAGVIVMANAGAAALSISIWLGVLAIMWGVLLICAGFSLRKAKANQI